jgi:hypothetical protein
MAARCDEVRAFGYEGGTHAMNSREALRGAWLNDEKRIFTGMPKG